MDVRAYLRQQIEQSQARKEQTERTLAKAGRVLALAAIAALWIAGWMIR